MNKEDIEACKEKMILFSEDWKKLTFSEMCELIKNLHKIGLTKELNFHLKEEYICNLFKISLDEKLDNYDFNTIISVLKILVFSNDIKNLENFDIILDKTNQKLIEDASSKPKKFEEFKLEIEVPNFLEKVYMYLNKDPNLLIKYSLVIFIKNICELTNKYCPELFDIYYYNVIYTMLLLQIHYFRNNTSILLILLRIESDIAFKLSTRDNPENLQSHMKLFCKTLILLKSKSGDMNVLKEIVVILNKLHNYIVIDPKKFENVFNNSNRTNFLKYIYKQTKIIKKEYVKRDKDRTHKQFKMMSHNLEENNFF